MKTTLLAATVLFGFTTFAQADHQIWRELDDLAFDGMVEARQARWEVRDHFTASRDFRELLEDVDQLARQLRDMQDAIYAERDPRQLRRMVDNTHDILLHLVEHAEHSDRARTIGGGISFRNGSIRYRPVTQHGGSIHVRELKAHADRVDAALHEMDEILDQMIGHDHHGGAFFPQDDGPRLAPPAPAPGIGVNVPVIGRGALRIVLD